MALTERYITHDAGGGGIGTEGDPWTYAEAVTNGVAGDRINVKAGAYSTGGVTFNTGSSTAPLIWRGYTTATGDLSIVKNADGTLDTTGYPVITVTGAQVPVAHTIFECIDYVGSFNASLLGGTNADTTAFIGVRAINNGSGSTTRAIKMDNDARIIGCELECTGATIANVIDSDNNVVIIGSRIKGGGAFKLITTNYGLIANNIIIGDGTSGGCGISYQSSGQRFYQFGNTFYNLDTITQYPNAANTVPQFVLDESATDCGRYLDNLYAATADINVLKIGNRTRDITSGDLGIGDWPSMSNVTTDTGGIETDYEAATSDDMRLIVGAPGRNASVIVANKDIGAAGHIDHAFIPNGIQSIEEGITV